LKIEGFPGSVRDGHFKGLTQIYSFQFGLGLGVSSGRYRRKKKTEDGQPPPPKPKRECSSPSISEVCVTKKQDAMSALLLGNAFMGKNWKRAEIVSVSSDGTLDWNMRLSDIVFSGVSSSAGSGDTSESLSLNFTAFEWTTFGHTQRKIRLPASLSTVKPDEAKTVANFKLARSPEVMTHIIGSLAPVDRLNAALVCKTFLRAAAHPSLEVVEKHSGSYDLTNSGPTYYDGKVIADVPPPREDDN